MNKKLIAPIVTAAAMLATSIGSTFALFSSKASSKIDINAGRVAVNYDATVSKALSRYEDDEPWDAIANKTETHAATFENGSTADISVESTGAVVTLDRLAPMDMIELKVGAENDSNINIKFRYFIKASGDLLPALDLIVDGASLEVPGSSLEFYSAWSSVMTPDVESLFEKNIGIYFPDHGEDDNQYQEKTATLEVGIEAIQGNAEVHDPVNPEAVNEPEEIHSKKPSAAGKSVNMESKTGSQSYVVPFEACDESAEELVLTIIPEEEPTVVVPEEKACLPYNIHIDGIKDDNTAEIEARIGIGQGKTNVQVFHDGTEIESKYVEDEGSVYFKATSFSPYDVVFDAPAFEINNDADLREFLNGTRKNGVLTNNILYADAASGLSHEFYLIDREVVLDLNGYKIDGYEFTIETSNFTFTGDGEITSKYGFFDVDSTITLDGVTLTSTISSKTSSNNGVLIPMGNCKIIVADDSENYINAIERSSGILMRALTADGAKLVIEGESKKNGKLDIEYGIFGDGIVFNQNAFVDLEITGFDLYIDGQIQDAYQNAIECYCSDGKFDMHDVNGTFNTDCSNYCRDGYFTKYNELTEMYEFKVVEEGEAVTKIVDGDNETLFGTLNGPFESRLLASETAKVILMQDVSLTTGLEIYVRPEVEMVEFDLNNKTIYLSSNGQIYWQKPEINHQAQPVKMMFKNGTINSINFSIQLRAGDYASFENMFFENPTESTKDTVCPVKCSGFTGSESNYLFKDCVFHNCGLTSSSKNVNITIKDCEFSFDKSTKKLPSSNPFINVGSGYNGNLVVDGCTFSVDAKEMTSTSTCLINFGTNSSSGAVNFTIKNSEFTVNVNNKFGNSCYLVGGTWFSSYVTKVGCENNTATVDGREVTDIFAKLTAV